MEHARHGLRKRFRLGLVGLVMLPWTLTNQGTPPHVIDLGKKIFKLVIDDWFICDKMGHLHEP